MRPDKRYSGMGIKTKLSAFALLASLVPMLSLGWLYYSSNRNLLQDKHAQGLHNSAINASREVARWLGDRRQEARVFSSSYVVGENLRAAGQGDGQAGQRLVEYLQSVGSRSQDYLAIGVLDRDGRVVAQSDSSAAWDIPPEWSALIELDQQPLSAPRQKDGRWHALIGTRVNDLSGRSAGVLLICLDLHRVESLLQVFASPGGESIYLLDEGSQLIVGLLGSGASAQVRVLPVGVRQRLAHAATQAQHFTHADGTEVVAASAPVGGSPWQVVAEQDSKEMFAEVRRLERLTTQIGAALVLLSALIAFVFARRLTAPLQRLTDGASRVAQGDLSVQVPVTGRNELTYLTRVFNNMVRRIAAGRSEREQINQQLLEQNQQLQVISNTDSLTGLYNRQHLNTHLSQLIETSRREQRVFAVLMADLDHFKRLNDQYGHLSGDEALRQVAACLTETVRSGDYVARFGGEEFLMLLPGADADSAANIAERIRAIIAAQPLCLNQGVRVAVTISIGIAVYPDAGVDRDSLMQVADEALYQAKANGRNQWCHGRPSAVNSLSAQGAA